MPVGNYRIFIQSLGYRAREIEIGLSDSGILEFALLPQAYRLEAIVVEDRADDRNVRSVEIGLEQLASKDIQELPAFLGEADLVRSLLTLPGVTTVGEGAAGFNTRGGNIDQNLILQDGALLFNASHVLGFFSVINPDVIQSLDLYKGHIPAQYGGRLSSTLDIQLKRADPEVFKMSGGLGLVSSRLALETPILKGKTSLLMAGRTSYSDWMLGLVNDPDVSNSSASFWDVNAKLTHRFGNGSNVNLSYFRSFDRFRFSQDFGYSWKMQNAALEWNQLFSETFSGSLTAAYGILENRQFEPRGIEAFNLDNGLDYYKVKQHFLLSANNHHTLQAGASWVRYEGRPEVLEPRGNDSAVIPLEVEKDKGQEWAVYLNDEITISDRLSVSLGLRYAWYQQLGPRRIFDYEAGGPPSSETLVDSTDFDRNEVIETYNGWEPRVSARWQFDARQSVKLAYNRLFQYIGLISNTTAATPVDLWQVSTRHIPPQSSHNFSLGYFRNFNDNQWETSIEGYYRYLPTVIEFRDLAELFLNPQLETELLQGEGRAYGLELAINRPAGDLSWRFSYTLARSLRRVDGATRATSINNGDWYPSNFDQPHSIKLALNYELAPRSELGLNFVYRTGRPVTAPNSNFFLGEFVFPSFSDRNQFRIPDYHRMDISYTLRPNAIRTQRFKWDLTFSVYNVYFRENAFSVFFRKSQDRQSNAFRLAVLGTAFPAVTFNFKY